MRSFSMVMCGVNMFMKHYVRGAYCLPDDRVS